jgi:hypothetical protein
MTYLSTFLFETPDIAAMGLWIFLSIGAVALFAVFLPLTTWMGTRQKEREAFYKAETLRRITESSGEGAKAAIEMMREESRLERIKKREGLKVGGLINIGVGVGLCIMLRSLTGREPDSPWLVGLIPGLIGVALLVYVFFMAPPIDEQPKP